MAGRARDGGGWAMESGKFLFRQQGVFGVIGQNHSFAADEQAAAVPLRDSAVFPDLGFALALMPREFDPREVAARAVFVGGAHRGGRDLRMRGWSAGLDGERGLKLERPEWEIVPMAAQVAHRAIAEIPPAIPFRSGEINGVEGPCRCRAEPEFPIQSFGHGLRFLGAFDHPDNVLVTLGVRFALPAPRSGNPEVRLVNGPDDPALNQFNHLAVI